MNKNFFKILFPVCLIVLSFFKVYGDDKIKPEEIVAKHLDSIGSKENRAKIVNQAIFFNSELKSFGTAPSYTGNAVLLSTKDKNAWAMNFNSNDYPTDKFGFDGKDAKAAFIRPGVRSVLGTFLLTYDKLLKESLLGGVLNLSWSLYSYETKNPKLRYEGTEKIKGKETFVLSYSPKGGSDLDIRMFFDKDNFRHIRTEYTKIVSAPLGSIDSSAGRDSQRYRFVEDFSDFKDIGGLTMPSTYNIFYSVSGGSSVRTATTVNRDIEWKFMVTNFSANQKIEDSFFEIN